MKRWTICGLLIAVFFTLPLMSQSGIGDFEKAIAYYLLKEPTLSKRFFNRYFAQKANYQLRNGFLLLLSGKEWEAAKKFKDYLDINHRSQIALVGIALATVDMRNSTTVENLKRAIRMNPRFASAYICIGVEHLKEKNYPAASDYLSRGLRNSSTPEFKIILGNLYLVQGEPRRVIDLLKGDADRAPDNYYFNLLTADALYRMNDWTAGRKYIEAALEMKPGSNEARLLKAKFLVKTGDYKQAKSILFSIKFPGFHEDFVRTMAHTLLELKDRKARAYLYEAFAYNNWDKDINRLMGRFYQMRKQNDNVQNWIYRSLLCGNSVESLKEIFGENYRYPEWPTLPFFEITALHWVSKDLIFVVGRLKSGENEKLYFLDPEKQRVLKSLSYNGTMQTVQFSRDKNRLLLATSNSEGDKTYLYAMERVGNNFRLWPIYRSALAISKALVGFNRAGDLVYITDATLADSAFESPFSRVSIYGKKKAVYPSYPFPIYKYNYVTKRLVQLKITQVDQLETIPIEAINKYVLVCQAFLSNGEINALIKKGQTLDITSSQVVKIHFAEDLSAFIIFLSDLKNAFQAKVYNEFNNRVTDIDETMFLGADRYAELKVVRFDPQERELLVLTKDKKRNLIHFNYQSFLYSELTKNVIDFCYNQEIQQAAVLTERSNNIHYVDTNLELISLNPFSNRRITIRRDLSGIESFRHADHIVFSTYNGELVRIDDEDTFTYAGISLKGALNTISEDGERVAVFVNGRLFFLDLNH